MLSVRELAATLHSPNKVFGADEKLTAPTDSTEKPQHSVSKLLLGWPGAVLPIAIYLIITCVWLAMDSRIPDFDSGRHLVNSFGMYNLLASGDVLAPYTMDNINHYPPLLYLLTTIQIAITGKSVAGAIFFQNLIFVPMLALGCRNAARIAFGPLAGTLAGIFALGVPIVASMFHSFMLDAPQAAAIAASVWLLLESRRFAVTKYAAWAGLVLGAAFLLKPTSPIFVAGLILVLIIRGGWRNPIGLLVFFGITAAVAAPWYIVHFNQIFALTEGFSGSPVDPTYLTPLRWSLKNAAWYGWDMLNIELLVPLTILVLAGVVTAIWQFKSKPSKENFTPELFAGGLVSYLGMSYLFLKDPRYTIPALVYMACFGVAWVAYARRSIRIIGITALIVIATINVLGVSFGLGDRVAILFPDSNSEGLGEWSLRLYSPEGYVVNAPRDDSDVLKVMKALPSRGIHSIDYAPGGFTFAASGLEALASTVDGLGRPRAWKAEVNRNEVMMLEHPLYTGGPKPCGHLSNGQGLYLIRNGSALDPFETQKHFYCPLAKKASTQRG